jgi:hypothetical protein
MTEKKFKTMAEYKAAGFDLDSRENQRIVSKMVERGWVTRVGSLISDICELITSKGGLPHQDSDLNDELPCEVAEVENDPEETIWEAGYDVVEHDGQWYWFEKKTPKPFGPMPPQDYTLKNVPGMEGVDSVAWYFTQPHDEDLHGPYDSDLEALAAAWQDVGLASFDEKEEAIADCMDENRIDPEHSEVYEHIAVDDHFAKELREHGEKVVDVCELSVWCRTCTGQSPSMDHVMTRIAFDRGILQGQEYSWEEKRE